MIHNIVQNRKVSEEMKLICFKSTAVNTSRRIYHCTATYDNKPYSQASCMCSDNKLLLIVPKFLHIKKHSAPLNYILYILLVYWRVH